MIIVVFRTQLYHTLLHYKFRLLLNIKNKLISFHYNNNNNNNSSSNNKLVIKRLLNDNQYIDNEIKRFKNVLNFAGCCYYNYYFIIFIIIVVVISEKMGQ